MERDPVVDAREYLRLWISPVVILPVAAMLLGLYVATAVQNERHSQFEARLSQVETDYQRRDVLAEIMRSMDQRLAIIEREMRTLQNGRPR